MLFHLRYSKRTPRWLEFVFAFVGSYFDYVIPSGIMMELLF